MTSRGIILAAWSVTTVGFAGSVDVGKQFNLSDITEGDCHAACEPTFVLLDIPGADGSRKAVTVPAFSVALGRSLRARDSRRAAELIRAAGSNVIRYSDAGRRLVIVSPCDSTRILDLYPVDDELRASLNRQAGAEN
jgi:hypothetical protein